MAGAELEQPGGRLGKYEILSLLATGGTSTVYKARDTVKDQVVALKVLTPERAENRIPRERFEREFHALRKLHHPNVVAVYAYGKKNSMYYLVMEYVDGIDLHRYVYGKGKLELDEVLDILIQAARALEHAHAEGIVHRDVKPSNFLITRKYANRVVKLTDFGLARNVLDSEEARLTRAGTTLGTVDYMSPEQTMGASHLDIRSDIYSLGCTGYFLLTGKPPFPEGSIYEKIRKQAHESPPHPHHFNPNIPDEVLLVLGKMLYKKPTMRHQTPTELLADLERLAKKPRNGKAQTGPAVATLPDGEAPTLPEAVAAFEAPPAASDDYAPLSASSLLWMLVGIGLSLVLVAVTAALWSLLGR